MIETSLCRFNSTILKDNNAGMKLLRFEFQLYNKHSLIFDIDPHRKSFKSDIKSKK